MSLGYGVVQLDVTIVNTALNSIGSSLGGGVSELQWVVSAYTIAFAAFILTAGALGDRIGAKRVFMAGFAIFTAASVACALAPNAIILIAARAVQGLGAAILVPNSLALLSHAYPDEKQRGRAVGIWAAGASLALIGRAAGRRRTDRAGRLAIDLPRQSADRSRRPVAELRAMPARPPDRRSAKSICRARSRRSPRSAVSPVRSSKAASGLEQSVRDRRLRRIGGSGDAVHAAGEARARNRCCRCRCSGIGMFALTSLVGLLVNVAFYGLIFVFSLYFQRVNGMSPFATGLAFLPMMGAVLPVNLHRAARGRTNRRAGDDRRWRGAVGVRMSGAARNRAGHQLLGNRARS